MGTAWFLIAEHKIAGQAGFPLDDSWIYATFARNLATGHGYSFNPGQPMDGATGPLYVVILSGLYAAFGGIVWPAKVLGILCLASSALIVSDGVRRALPRANGLPLLAGLLTALSPPLLWGCLSGLEIPLYLVLVSVGLNFHLRERWTLASLCWSAGVWLRPDGLLLAALGLACPAESRKRVALVTGLLILGYFGFNLALGGGFFPTSVSAKARIGGDVLAREWATIAQWLWLWGLSLHAGRVGPHSVLLLSALTAGALLMKRRDPVVAVYPAAFPVVFGLFGPNGGQHGRYLVSVIPFGIVLACLGLSHTWIRIAAASPRMIGNLASTAMVALLLSWQAATGRLFGITYGWNVQNINGMHRFIAEEVVRRIPTDEVIAVNDVGAMGYFGRHRIVDLAGLMSPRRSLPENLAIYRPLYMVVFPNWFHQYVVIDSTTGQPIFRDPSTQAMYSAVLGVKLRHNTIASRKMMVVYKRFPIDSPAVANPELVLH